jgi:SAM-dependent methyltransferase
LPSAGQAALSGRTPSYDQFAPHFDAWQRAFGPPYDALILPRVTALLERHAPRVRRVVDLGVGTGDLAVALARRGYDVVGVDCSEPMLAVSRAKAAAAALATPPRFVPGDIRTVRLDPPADAAICVYTVVNQLTADDDLGRAFTAVAGALVPGGLFVLETNLPASYDRYWSGTETIQAGDATIVREHRHVAGTSVIEALVTIRTPDGAVHDRIRQRPWTDDDVERALATAGFAPPTREAFNPFEPSGPPMKALWAAQRRRA